MSRWAILLTFLGALLAPAATAITIVDTFPDGGGGAHGFGTAQEMAQSFTPASTTTLGHIDVDISLTSGGTSHVQINVWSSSGSLPGATLIATANLDGLTAATPRVVGVDFPTLPTLTGGVTYWVGVDAGAGTSINWIISQGGASVAEPYRADGGAWQVNFGGANTFRVLSTAGATVPEPATVLLAALGLGLSTRRRRR